MATKTMHDLLITFMQDVYYAERQILKALPKMAKASQNEELKNALMHHCEETQGQVDRLQKAFEALGKRPRGQTCEAINGLIELHRRARGFTNRENYRLRMPHIGGGLDYSHRR